MSRLFADFSKAIETDSTYTEAYLHRGKAYQVSRQSVKAKKDLEKAHKMAPHQH